MFYMSGMQKFQVPEIEVIFLVKFSSYHFSIQV